jgi:hypothetical protein
MRHLNKKAWPYQAILRESTISTVDKWCENVVGKEYEDWYAYNNSTYAFKTAEHLFLFKLTWKTKDATSEKYAISSYQMD